MKKNNKTKSEKKAPAKAKKTSKSKGSMPNRKGTFSINASNKNSVGVVPLGDRVLVKALSQEESGTLTSFGIVIPDSSKEKPEQGEVVAVGPGKHTENGTLMEMSVKVGDRVMFSKYGFDEIKVGGVEYLILPETSILAIINQ